MEAFQFLLLWSISEINQFHTESVAPIFSLVAAFVLLTVWLTFAAVVTYSQFHESKQCPKILFERTECSKLVMPTNSSRSSMKRSAASSLIENTDSPSRCYWQGEYSLWVFSCVQQLSVRLCWPAFCERCSSCTLHRSVCCVRSLRPKTTSSKSWTKYLCWCCFDCWLTWTLMTDGLQHLQTYTFTCWWRTTLLCLGFFLVNLQTIIYSCFDKTACNEGEGKVLKDLYKVTKYCYYFVFKNYIKSIFIFYLIIS